MFVRSKLPWLAAIARILSGFFSYEILPMFYVSSEEGSNFPGNKESSQGNFCIPERKLGE